MPQDLSTKLAASKSIAWCMKDRTLRLLLGAALFLVIVGARFLIIHDYGSDLPFWDQWDTEGEALYSRYFNGTLTLGEWFAPSNEHRVLFSRLLSLALLLANGQWDGRLQMAANALFYALFASALFLLLAKPHALRFTAALTVVIGVIFTLPLGFENTLWGFQSQFYFLSAFSLATIWLLANKPAWSFPWIAGGLIGFSCLFTMASGLLSAVAVMVLLLCKAARERWNWSEKPWPTGAVCLLIILAGFLLSVTVERHAVLQARSVSQFIGALGYCLSWPGIFLSPWWALVNWLPFLVLVVAYLRGLAPDGRYERFTLGIGIWLLFQAAATAFARSLIVHAPRYADMLSLGLLVNFMSIHLVASRYARPAKAKFAVTMLVMVWLAGNALGLARQTSLVVGRVLPYKGYTNSVEEFRTARTVTTQSIKWLTEGVQGGTEIPYPDPQKLFAMLARPEIRRILPAGVSEPLYMKVHSGSPQMTINTSFATWAPPHTGERIWRNEAFGSTTAAAGFECITQKREGLPFIFMHVSGGDGQLFVTDARNRRHPVTTLSPRGNGVWLPAYAYCPGPTVRIGAAAEENTAPAAFSEPREMGVLSLGALLITDNAPTFIVTGTILFCFALIFSALRLIMPAPAELPKGEHRCTTSLSPAPPA